MAEEQSQENDELITFTETYNKERRHTTFKESNPLSRERGPTRDTERETNSRATCPSSQEGSYVQEQKKRVHSIYSQRQSVKPLNIQAMIEAQKRISLNPTYIKKRHRNFKLHERLYEKVRLTKACHRPVAVPLVQIIGKIPSFVDVSELQGLRREFEELQKDYHNIVERRRYDVHRRHVELMEIDKITSERLRKRFIETLRAYGISNSVIADVLAELQIQ